MRKNLVSMLDGINLNVRLGIPSCLDLFDASSQLAHFTSTVEVPIFKKGENYRGYGPSLFKVSALKRWIVETLAVELASVPGAVIVPLGRVADEAIQFFRKHDLVSSDRYLTGFPPIGRERPSQGRLSAWSRTME